MVTTFTFEFLEGTLKPYRIFNEESLRKLHNDISVEMDGYLSRLELYTQNVGGAAPESVEGGKELISLAHNAYKQIVFNIKTACDRYTQDRDLLEASGLDIGKLKGVELTSGDPHAGQQRVLKFLGTRGALAYKPRPSSIDSLINRLFEMANSADVSLQSIPQVDRKTYSWQKWIDPSPALSETEVYEYFTSCGAALAIFDVLEGTDLHQDNVIARRANPCFVDLETVVAHSAAPRRASSESSFNDLYRDSVLGTMFLPGQPQNSVFDVSIGGITNGRLEASPNQTYAVLSTREDGQKIYVDRPIQMPSKGNRLFFEGRVVDPAGYASSIARGYRLALNRLREEISEVHRLIDTAGNAEVRIVVRPTAVYQRFMDAILHPLRSEDPGRTLDLLAPPPHPNLSASVVKWIMDSEKSCMLNLDVPIFKRKLGSRDLINARGCSLANYFRTTAIEDLHDRVDKVLISDTAKSRAHLNQTLILNSLATAPSSSSFPTTTHEAAPHLFNEDFEKACQAVKYYLQKSSVHLDGHETWIVPRLTSAQTHILMPSDDSLMEGGGSKAAMWAVNTNTEDTSKLSDEAFGIAHKNGDGLFNGVAGHINILQICEGEPYPELPPLLRDRIAGWDSQLGSDYTYGISGLGVSLLALPPKGRASLVGNADQAIATLERSLEQGRYDGQAQLAHGSMGMLLGVVCWSVVGDKPLPTWFASRWEEERLHYPGQRGWCRGLDGAVSASVRIGTLLGITPEKNITMHEQAISKLGVYERTADYSVCHGWSGQVESLLNIAKDTNCDDLLLTAEKLAQEHMSQARSHGYKSGVANAPVQANYITGLGGYLYTLHRLRKPESPSLVMPHPYKEEV